MEHTIDLLILGTYTHLGQMIMRVDTPTRVTGIDDEHRNRVLISDSLHRLKVCLPASFGDEVEISNL